VLLLTLLSQTDQTSLIVARRSPRRCSTTLGRKIFLQLNVKPEAVNPVHRTDSRQARSVAQRKAAMSARRPNYTAVADGTAPDFELTTTQRSSDNQPAQDDRSRGESSTRNPLVENSDTDDENDVEKGTETTAPKEVEEEMMDLRCLDLQVRPDVSLSQFHIIFLMHACVSPVLEPCLLRLTSFSSSLGLIFAGKNVQSKGSCK